MSDTDLPGNPGEEEQKDTELENTEQDSGQPEASQQEHHNPMTEEDTASGGAPER